MIFVYVAGPFSATKGEIEKIRKAELNEERYETSVRGIVDLNIARVVEWGVKIAELGFFPVMPHANTADPRFEKIQPYPFWIDGTMELMLRSDVLFLTPRWELSNGAREENERQRQLGRPVFDSLDALFEWGKCLACDGEGRLLGSPCEACLGRKARARP